MRRTHHAPGSPAAQSTLQVIAGWTPTRRSFVSGLTGMLALGAVPAVAAITDTVPEPACPGVPPASVSPRMMQLVADFTRLTTALYAVEFNDDPAEWNGAAELRRPALESLVFERPTTIADFAAKLAALVEFMADADTELFVLRRLSEDATALAGGAK